MFGIAVCSLAAVPVLRACQFTYAIWSIRNKPADPLFRFVRKGKAGYIDASGKMVIQPTLDAGGNTVLRAEVRLAFDFSQGLAPASKDGKVIR